MNSTQRLTTSLFTAVVVLLTCASIAVAQPARPTVFAIPSAVEANDYGINSVNYLMIPGTDFIPSDSTTGYIKPYLFLQRTGGGSSEFTHVLNLPSGALVQTITAYVTDSNVNQDVTLRVCRPIATSTGAYQDLSCDGNLGTPLPVSTSGTPGQTALVMNVNLPFLTYWNNWDTSWVILVHLAATDSSHRLHSVKVAWKRQVSPAPGTASFLDVPTTHVFYQYIEALAASGITAGCGGGNFCPDTFLTRGQMAAFLAKGLGLHWSP